MLFGTYIFWSKSSFHILENWQGQKGQILQSSNDTLASDASVINRGKHSEVINRGKGSEMMMINEMD